MHLVGRSFKYHRPRGIVAAGSEEPNALVEVDRGPGRRTPNLRATQVELYDGLVAHSQNRFPSLHFDLGAATDRLAPLFPAGFYYKTFLWPRTAWAKLYEPLIRRAAGLGRAPELPDPDGYAQQFAHCDVLVVGAGPAGLAAARKAAASGARVILCDEQAEFGGSLLAERQARIDGQPAADWLGATLGELFAAPGVRMLARTTAFGIYGHNLVGLVERVSDHLADPDPALPRERLWQVRAKQIVLAAGAIERPLVFPDNDRPGIMLAGAARDYAARYGVRPGTRAVIVTRSDTAYVAALDVAGCGRRGGADRRSARGVRGCGAGYPGRDRRYGARNARAAPGSRHRTHAARRPARNRRGGPGRHERRLDRPRSISIRRRAAGRASTLGSAPSCRMPRSRISPVSAPAAASSASPPRWPTGPARTGRWRARTRPASAPAPPAPAPPGRAFVDFQNDVTAKDLHLAAQEGFRSIEHVKRYTTTGMATDQGKTSNINALGIVAGSLGVTPDAVGLTTFRPPYTPVTFGALAGLSREALFDPVRTTPIHAWAEAHGAEFEDVGAWKRARCFPTLGEDMHAAVQRECRTVRSAVGLFDASTLGKIEVVGADAAEFLERMYVNSWKALKPGRCRYGVLLGENGFLLDDGVIGRLAPDRFHVTTGTGSAARVLALMEDYRQTEWPELDVWLTSTTEQWAVIAVQGPRARDAIAPVVDGVDLSRAAMPHMSVRPCSRPGGAGPAVRRELHRRDGLRDQRAGGFRHRRLGSGVDPGARAGRLRLRDGGDARAEGRERLHHHRPRD